MRTRPWVSSAPPCRAARGVVYRQALLRHDAVLRMEGGRRKKARSRATEDRIERATLSEGELTAHMGLDHRQRLDSFRRSLTPMHGAYGILLIVSGLLIIPPLIMMVWTSLTPGTGFEMGGEWSASAYEELAVSDNFIQVISNTSVFGVSTVVGSLMLGIAMAWLVARTDAPFKSLIYACVFLQFAVPGMIWAIGWIFLLGPGAGFINTFLVGSLGLPIINIESMLGMVFVETLVLSPVVFLLLVGPFGTMDTSLEESARVCGASKMTVYRRITTPLLLPSLLSVAILVLIRAVQSFEVPLFLGTPAGIKVFTTEVFLELRNSMIPDYALSLIHI